LGNGEAEAESAALPDLALYPNSAAMGLRQPLEDVEAKAKTLFVSGTGTRAAAVLTAS